MDLKKYKTWIFDCDGVLLDSNSVKTEAFYEVALPYGRKYAEAFVTYHKKFGGISRFEKFNYFFEHILEKNNFAEHLEESLEMYASLVRTKLLQCAETEGSSLFLEKISNVKRKIVISGGMQEELRDVFSKRKLSRYFDDIYGSPDSKIDIMQKELNKGLLRLPAVFVGDSKYDYECARMFKIDFIFMHQYSEFVEWQDYFINKRLNVIANLGEFLSAMKT